MMFNEDQGTGDDWEGVMISISDRLIEIYKADF